MKVDKYLDDRNTELWKYLNTKFRIKIRNTSNKYASCFAKNNNVKIFLNPEISTSSCLTHELLHVWIRDKDIYIGAGLQSTITSNYILNQIFSDNLIDQLGDWFDHIKIYPKFIDLGYDKSTFLSDNNVVKFSVQEALRIHDKYRENGLIDLVMVDLFIAKYFSSKADISSGHDYSESLEILEKTDSDLFRILDRIWQKWEEVDIDNKNNDGTSYHEVCYLLYDIEEYFEYLA
jgi:hypothetical protein